MDLHKYFDSIELSTIEALIANSEVENIHLDFKTVRDASLNSSDDRKTLAKAISGFANSEGGLIVWGIDCRPNQEGIDCASASKPIADLSKLISRLEELTGEAVAPRIAGIRHKAIHYADEDRGFAVSLVPEVDGGPYMAGLTEGRYYKRSGSAFYRMEHFDVADMFGRRLRPNLRLVGRPRYTANPARVSVLLAIKNIGRGTAVAPFLEFRSGPLFGRNHFGFDGNCNEGMTRRISAPDMRDLCIYSESASFVIHPGVFLPVCEIRTADGAGIGLPDTVSIEFAVCAEGLPLRKGLLEIKPYSQEETEA